MKNTDQAFTLIELLIVIGIVGILAAILIPNLLSARNSTQKMAGQVWGRQMLAAAQAQLTGGTAIGGIATGAKSTTCGLGINANDRPADIASPPMTAANNCKVNKDGEVAVQYVVEGKTYSWNSIISTVTDTDRNFTGTGVTDFRF